MEIQKVRFAYFTPIQLTRKVAYNITAGFGPGMPSEQFNLTAVVEREREHQVAKEELLVVSVPSFGGRVPVVQPALMRNLHGQGGPAVVVVTYGGRAYEDTLLEMQMVLEEQGFVVVAGAAFVTAHSMSPKVVAPGRPNAKDLAKAREFGKLVREKVEGMESIERLQMPGNDPLKPQQPPAPFAPETNEKCVLCMQCYRWCPMDAITWNDPNETDASKCVLCQGCVVRCPVEARQVTNEGFRERVAGMEQQLANVQAEAEFFL